MSTSHDSSSTKLKVLRFAARHPGVSLGALCGLGLLLAGATLGGTVCLSRSAPAKPAATVGAATAGADAAVAASISPRLILNRGWFDRYPGRANEEIKLLVFFAGGIGVYQAGSAYRLSVDVFEFERQGDKVNLAFLQDREGAETRFSVSHCEENPPFNLCLDLESSPRGPRRYYGFGDEEDMAARIPWSKKLLRAARSHTETR